MERPWIRVAAAAAIVAGSSASQAGAQYAPYRLAQQQAAAAATPVTAPAVGSATTQPAYAPYRPQAQRPVAAAAAQPTARLTGAAAYPRVASNYPQVESTYPAPTATYPQSSATYPTTAAQSPSAAANPQVTYPQATSPQTSVAPYSQSAAAPYGSAASYPQTSAAPYGSAATQYPVYPTYPVVAQQADDVAPSDDTLPAPNRGADVVNGASANGASANGVQSNGAANGYSMPSANGTSLQVENGPYGYPATNYSNGGVVGADGADCGHEGYPDYGLGSYFDNPHHDSNWFGGVYYLFMTRDDADYRRLTAQFDTPAGGYPYYPAPEWTALSSSHVDHDYRSGVELRFGSTFGVGGHDDCDTACGTPYGYGYGSDCNTGACDVQQFAWEFGYWFLDDDLNTAQVIDSIPTDTNRIYGMKNFAGLTYNGRDVNDWYDYQMPVTDPAAPGATDVRILAQRVRSSFQAQNIELNFLRLPVCGMDACGGYGADGCEPACGSPFSMATLCGVRYLRVDDDFEYATMPAVLVGGVPIPPAYTPWDGVDEVYYDIQVDNELVGFQLGANMNYCVSCKCNVFWNSSFGLYNNHIEVYQRVYGDAGPATWTQTGADAVIYADKDDIAFAGEMLIGTSYNFTCNCRGVLAYRAVAVSGIGLSVDQIPENFANEADVALVDSNGSLIIHGVQIGTEWRY